MPVDNQRYSDLIRRAAFNAEYWRGTIQDLSDARLPMAFVGNPRWGRINGRPALRQASVLDGTSSANVPAIVDVTGAFSVEWCGVPMIDFVGAGEDILLAQVGPVSGGFSFLWDNTNAVYVLILWDNAAAVARSIALPAGSAVLQRTTHVIITSGAGGTVGTATINGEPVVATLGGAGVAANINADAPVVAGGGAVGIMESLLARASVGIWGREDQTCLAEQAKLLVGGSW